MNSNSWSDTCKRFGSKISCLPVIISQTCTCCNWNTSSMNIYIYNQSRHKKSPAHQYELHAFPHSWPKQNQLWVPNQEFSTRNVHTRVSVTFCQIINVGVICDHIPDRERHVLVLLLWTNIYAPKGGDSNKSLWIHARVAWLTAALIAALPTASSACVRIAAGPPRPRKSRRTYSSREHYLPSSVIHTKTEQREAWTTHD